eukprot:2720718-Ditylum_brightwellii.AAC.1
MTFLLNPFDAALNLSNKEDRKLFEAGTKELSDDLKLTGNKEKFNNFRKLISKRTQKVRLMEALDALTKREAGADPNNLIKIINIFNETGITKGQVEAHVDL